MSGANRRSFRAVGAAAVAVVVGVLAIPAEAVAAGAGVCTGVIGCRVVSQADVNGDGIRDSVGIARRGASGSVYGSVIVRVKVAPRRIVQVTRKLEPFYGSPWQGASPLDGRRGAELMIGHMAGAHTQFFQALTWRDGGLVNLRAPGAQRDWVVDGAWSVALGWQRRSTDPVGTLLRREAYRNGSSSTFTAKLTRYRWSSVGWQRVRTTTNARLPENAASSWGGFLIRGLQRY